MFDKMCIFDLDGTLDYKIAKLSAEILKLSKMRVCFVVATGRSNNFVLRTFKKNNIILPRFIIADNGGTIYDTIEKKFLRKRILPTEIREQIISKYLKLGGRVEEIRYSDGDRLYCCDDDLVRSFYLEDKTVQYHSRDEIVNELLRDDVDVTKITLSANKTIMDDLVKFIGKEEIKCFPDGGNTKFPTPKSQNYRVDITDGETSKGEGTKFLTQELRIGSFLCIGNGQNDLSMFKFAIDTGNKAVIVRNYEKGIILPESKELIEEMNEYASKQGRESNLIIATYPANRINSKLEQKNHSSGKREGFIRRLQKGVKGSIIPNPHTKGKVTRLRPKGER